MAWKRPPGFRPAVAWITGMSCARTVFRGNWGRVSAVPKSHLRVVAAVRAVGDRVVVRAIHVAPVVLSHQGIDALRLVVNHIADRKILCFAFIHDLNSTASRISFLTVITFAVNARRFPIGKRPTFFITLRVPSYIWSMRWVERELARVAKGGCALFIHLKNWWRVVESCRTGVPRTCTKAVSGELACFKRSWVAVFTCFP